MGGGLVFLKVCFLHFSKERPLVFIDVQVHRIILSSFVPICCQASIVLANGRKLVPSQLQDWSRSEKIKTVDYSTHKQKRYDTKSFSFSPHFLKNDPVINFTSNCNVNCITYIARIKYIAMYIS